MEGEWGLIDTKMESINLKEDLYQPTKWPNGKPKTWCNIGLLDWFGGPVFNDPEVGALSDLFDYDITIFYGPNNSITCPDNENFMKTIKGKAIELTPEYAQEMVNKFGKPAGIFGTWATKDKGMPFWHCMIICVDKGPYDAKRGPKVANIGAVNAYMYLNQIAADWAVHYNKGELAFFTLKSK
jgi:hypothetical protein